MLSAGGLWWGKGPGTGRGAVGGDLLEEVAEGGEAVGAVAVRPASLGLGEELGAGAAGDFALGGEPDQLGAAIGGVGDALDVAELGQVVDDLADRLLGHARQGGELGEAHALLLEKAEDAAVGRTDVAVAGVPEGRAELDQDRLGGVVEQGRQWRRAIGDFSGWRHLVREPDKVA